MAEVPVLDQTRTSATEPRPSAQPSTTRTIEELVEDAGYYRNVARLLENDFGDIQHRGFEAQLNAKANEIARRPAVDILTSIADQGFAWRDIARMIGVSVPAVRRWRTGEALTGLHRLATARLAAILETLSTNPGVFDVAAWMEMPLTPDVPVTRIDLAAEGCFADLFDLASNHITAEGLLDRWQPEWRERYCSDFEVFEAEDGELGIRRAHGGTIDSRDV